MPKGGEDVVVCVEGGGYGGGVIVRGCIVYILSCGMQFAASIAERVISRVRYALLACCRIFCNNCRVRRAQGTTITPMLVCWMPAIISELDLVGTT